MNEVVERSRELFDSGFNCAESVFLAVAESRGDECTVIPGVATGFCSGMARTERLCGAVSGGVLAVGLALGRSTPDQSVEDCYRAVREVIDGFVSRFGSDNCCALTGCRLGTEEGQARFATENLHALCGEFVAEGTRLALKAIAGTSRLGGSSG
jgi:C_GCAxxG_C_C family probable redox protein